jgi:23S rRNA (pseudouridine1915-N3)-methyltransferase
MITILHVGKVKDRSISALIGEYAKRIGKYAKLVFSEAKEEKVRRERASELEGERIIAMKKAGMTVCLDASGKKYTSEEFAMFLKGRDICFIIGGYQGVSEELKGSCDQVLSLSQMTFTHEMAQLILLEQVYRAFTILNNENYHK